MNGESIEIGRVMRGNRPFKHERKALLTSKNAYQRCSTQVGVAIDMEVGLTTNRNPLNFTLFGLGSEENVAGYLTNRETPSWLDDA